MACRVVRERIPGFLHVDPTPTSDPKITSVVSFFIFVAAVRVVAVLCFYFSVSSCPAMWVSIRVGHFDRSVVRPMDLFYPVPGLVLSGLGCTF